MQTIYERMGCAELGRAIDELQRAVDGVASRGLALDMTRGKPSPEQVAISLPLLDAVSSASDLHDGTVDCGNYGCFEGIPSARRLGAELLGTCPEQTLALGSSSLLVARGVARMLWLKGTCGQPPWGAYARDHGGRRVRCICPVPGYDRHFRITGDLGMVNVPVAMGADGPDMDAIERLVAEDDAVKGIWCVPKYSNPTGVTFSARTVRRLATMSCAAADFRIFWDNAYGAHGFADADDELANIFDIARDAGTADRVVAFASTSKITFPGAGIAWLAASPAVLREFSEALSATLISADKINQLRHARFLPSLADVRRHMRRHARFLRPRFELVDAKLTEGLAGTGCATWTRPRGGYFVSLDGPEGSARLVVALCARMGVKLTPAGATWPGGVDARDTNIRIAPSYPSLDELALALDALVLAVRLVAARQARERVAPVQRNWGSSPARPIARARGYNTAR